MGCSNGRTGAEERKQKEEKQWRENEIRDRELALICAKVASWISDWQALL